MAAPAIANTSTLRGRLYPRLVATRARTLELVKPLSAEDMVVQPMDDASPTKWHLAHVTWFFETFVLAKFLPGYRGFDETFNFCFNSYYESQGARQPRGMRGCDLRSVSSKIGQDQSASRQSFSANFLRATVETARSVFHSDLISVARLNTSVTL